MLHQHPAKIMHVINCTAAEKTSGNRWGFASMHPVALIADQLERALEAEGAHAKDNPPFMLRIFNPATRNSSMELGLMEDVQHSRAYHRWADPDVIATAIQPIRTQSRKIVFYTGITADQDEGRAYHPLLIECLSLADELIFDATFHKSHNSGQEFADRAEGAREVMRRTGHETCGCEPELCTEYVAKPGYPPVTAAMALYHKDGGRYLNRNHAIQWAQSMSLRGARPVPFMIGGMDITARQIAQVISHSGGMIAASWHFINEHPSEPRRADQIVSR